jgi:hypothetical protein
MTRIATYRPGAVDEERRWPQFQSWFMDTVEALQRGLVQVRSLKASW